MSGLVAFHYKSYGTFLLYSKRLHNLREEFTHYRNYRALFSYPFCVGEMAGANRLFILIQNQKLTFCNHCLLTVVFNTLQNQRQTLLT